MADEKHQPEEKKEGENQKPAGVPKRRQFLSPKGLKGRGQKPMLRGEDDFNWGKVLRVVLSWSAIIMAVFLA